MTEKWHLIAYDITDPRRLRRVHYHLKSRAWMIQRSVYLLRCQPSMLRELESELKKLTDHRSDDIRLYPISSPDALWEAGPRPDALSGVFPAATQQKGRGLLKRLVAGLVGKKRVTIQLVRK